LTRPITRTCVAAVLIGLQAAPARTTSPPRRMFANPLRGEPGSDPGPARAVLDRRRAARIGPDRENQNWEPTQSAAPGLSPTHPECPCRSRAPRSTQSDGARLPIPSWISPRKRPLAQSQYGQPFSKTRLSGKPKGSPRRNQKSGSGSYFGPAPEVRQTRCSSGGSRSC
jgi:hypothetical protein